jgi:DNA-binding GntR family transcriptional regulator
MIGIRSITSPSVVDQSTAEIRRAILSGSLKPGQPFSLSDLSVQLGVSAIPVREALRRLETEGLISMKPARSAVVRPLALDEYESIHRLLALIEFDVATRAVERRDKQALQEAEQHLNEMMADEFVSDAFFLAHQQFHDVLLRPGMSEWDSRLLRMLRNSQERYDRLAFSSGEWTKQTHKDLLVSASTVDSGEFLDELTRHHRFAREAVIARLSPIMDSFSPAQSQKSRKQRLSR